MLLLLGLSLVDLYHFFVPVDSTQELGIICWYFAGATTVQTGSVSWGQVSNHSSSSSPTFQLSVKILLSSNGTDICILPAS